MFKKHGFKRTGFSFFRRQGTVEHYFDVQLSQYNFGPKGHFYLNTGVLFDDLLRLQGQAPPKHVKIYHCQFHTRLDALDPQVARQVDIDENTDVEPVAKWLTERVENSFVVPLNAVSSTRDFLSTGWVHIIPWGFPAMFYYVLGDKEESHRLLENEAQTFVDRGCTFQKLADSLHLTFP